MKTYPRYLIAAVLAVVLLGAILLRAGLITDRKNLSDNAIHEELVPLPVYDTVLPDLHKGLIRPSFQLIELNVDPDQPDYTGVTRTQIQLIHPTKIIPVRAGKGNTIRHVRLKTESSETVLSFRTDPNGTAGVISDDELNPGKYDLEIEFSAEFSKNLKGVYKVEFESENYVFTNYWGKKTPGPEKTPYKIAKQLKLSVPKSLRAISNTPVESTTINGNFKTLIFEPTGPIDDVCDFAVGPLDVVDVPGAPVPTRIVTVKDYSEKAGAAAKMAVPILNEIIAYFGGSYPHSKLDLIAVPQLGAPFERPGIIYFRDNLILFDSPTPSAVQRRKFVTLMTHETVHTWFCDLLTPPNLEIWWLQEAPTVWLEIKLVDRIFPEFNYPVMVVPRIHEAMEVDARLSTCPLVPPPESQLRLNPASHEMLIYQKSSAILKMFENWIGEETFRAGISDFAQTHAWSYVIPDDLTSALARHTRKDIIAAANTFIKQPGVPLVEVYPLEGGLVRINQRQFFNGEIDTPSQLLWHIPVTLRYPANDRVITQQVLLTKRSQVFELETKETPKWIYPNSGEAGYYRWQVPPDMLMLLAQESRILLDPRERAGLIGNLTALLEGGFLPADRYLSALNYFAYDDQPHVISFLVATIDKIAEELIPEELEQSFSAYVREVLSPALERWGIEPAVNESPDTALLRPKLVYCLGDKGRMEKVLVYTRSLAERYRQDPFSVDGSMAQIAVRLCALNGNRELFLKYIRKFETAQNISERRYYLATLGLFRDTELMREALDYSLEGPLKFGEYQRVAEWISRTPAARDLLLQWVMAKYDKITVKYPRSRLFAVPLYARGASMERLHKARSFFLDPSRVTPKLKHAVDRLEETVLHTVWLRKREGRAVAEFLNQIRREEEP